MKTLRSDFEISTVPSVITFTTFSVFFFCSLNQIRSDTSKIQTKTRKKPLISFQSKSFQVVPLQDLCSLSQNNHCIIAFVAFYSCPSRCHPVKSTLQTCRHTCLDSSADRVRSWLSSRTFHARAKFPFLVFVGDTSSLPSSKGSCLSRYSRLLTSPTAQACKPFELHSLLQYRK